METKTKSGLKLGGHFVLEHWRDGKLLGVSKSKNVLITNELLARFLELLGLPGHNIVTNEMLNFSLNVLYHGTAAIGTWYCIIVNTNTVAAAGMTYAVPVFTESTAYTSATRPEYVEAASSGQSITNAASKAVFTMNAGATIYGAALVGGGGAPTTKGNTAGGGKLACYSLISPSRVVISGDVINLTYVVTAVTV